ncbi:MAG: hypothetical protein HC908_00550 [Calothrix sp. SM1_7_51]|nr:hypothetical protein [Calothrix sp. SM1_7_51]
MEIFVSLYDPIISSTDDVNFGSYTGAALKVETTGSINVSGDINITSPDFNLQSFCGGDTCSDDALILANNPAVILRAGVSSLQEQVANIQLTSWVILVRNFLVLLLILQVL